MCFEKLIADLCVAVPKRETRFGLEESPHDLEKAFPWLEGLEPRLETSRHPLLPGGIKWVKTAIERCASSHKCQLREETPLPTRVLSLAPSSQDACTVKLVNGRGLFGRYATLSHCWGGHLSCTTTTTNLRERTLGVSWEEISRTFQDAMLYCLELGIGYIWIGALCILQDDPADWQAESAKMADIYQNSYITLAATSASNGNAGCFSRDRVVDEHKVITIKAHLGPDAMFPRGDFCSPFVPKHLRWSIEPRDEVVPLIGVRHKLTHWPDTTSSEADLTNYPLLSRGWVFQERILSSRILHFNTSELAWECTAEVFSECGGLVRTQRLKQGLAEAISFANSNKKKADNPPPYEILAGPEAKMSLQDLPQNLLPGQMHLNQKEFQSQQYQNILNSPRHANSVRFLVKRGRNWVAFLNRSRMDTLVKIS